MIDLNNTWCEATEENYNALLSLGLEKQKGGFVYPKNGKLRILKNTIIEYDFDSNIETTQKLKQIYLVNGEFQYVETKHKNNFKDYGFEADFEGEILKEFDCCYIGWIKTTDIRDNDIFKVGKFLKANGDFYASTENGEVNIKKYNLKQIKKKWYENHDNFPCLVIEDDENLLICNDTYEWIDLDIHHSGNFRPATKEEVLSLLVKE